MKTLFISYNSALEPLIQSQGIPYLKGLSERGVECFLLSFEKIVKDKDNFRIKIENLRKELKDYSIKWYHLKYHKRPTLPATLFDISAGIIVGLYIVISKRVNIVHARATVPAVMACVISRITRAKFIFDERGIMAEEYADGGIWKRRGFLYNLTRNIEKRLLKMSDAIVVLTENIRDFFLNSDYSLGIYDKKIDITVIPCCVDLKRFSDLDRKTERLRGLYKLGGKYIFLYIGSFGTWYLLEEMIDFFLVSKTIINNAHFLILTHTSKKFVEYSLKKRSLSSDDITIDSVAFSEIPAYIKLADAGIFFIKPLFSKRSSCPIKFAEYLASGLPVIINRGIGDTDRIVEQNGVGVVIDKFSRESYLSGAVRLLKIMKEGDVLTERCRKTAKEIFSLDIGVSRYFDIYNRVNLESKKQSKCN